MTYNFTEKNAVVTGASRGLGEAIARTLAGDGARVALVARSSDKLKQLANSLPNDPVVIEGDLSVPDGWKVIADSALEALGKVDILVNNAGVNATESLNKLTSESFDQVMMVNVRNLVLLTHALGASLAKRQGAVVNISSVSAYCGGVGQIAYSTSKGAVNSFTRNASRDLGRVGVRVNGIAPGVIDDGMWKTAFEGGVDREETMERMRPMLPLQGRWGTAQDIANAVAWLASDKSGYVTGQTIRVDGGMIM